jgi:hypothetical protein
MTIITDPKTHTDTLFGIDPNQLYRCEGFPNRCRIVGVPIEDCGIFVEFVEECLDGTYDYGTGEYLFVEEADLEPTP